VWYIQTPLHLLIIDVIIIIVMIVMMMMMVRSMIMIQYILCRDEQYDDD